ncbi:hypothetical protein T439DRAFT_74520 [Meredithblackwellia eburnea MCA 4105]
MGSPFTPRYPQPVTIEHLTQLEPDTLTAELTRLSNSISHLRRSNLEILRFCTSGEEGGEGGGEEGLDRETRDEFEATVRENEVTIARQEERQLMIRLALERKLGVDATNTHYELATGTSTAAVSTTMAPRTTDSARRAETRGDVSESEESTTGGVYL